MKNKIRQILSNFKIIFFSAVTILIHIDTGNAQYTINQAVRDMEYTTQPFTAGSLIYNFTTASSQAYGNNMPLIDAAPVRNGIFSGDINQDGTIDAGDLSLGENDVTNSLSGYEPD